MYGVEVTQSNIQSTLGEEFNQQSYRIGSMAQSSPRKTLLTIFERLYSSELRPENFVCNGLSAERVCEDSIVQVVGLRLSRDKTWFITEFGWRFSNHDFATPEEYATLFRLGQFHGNYNRGDTIPEFENLDRACQSLNEEVRREVIPFLNKFATARAILDSVSAGELSAELAFGSDGGWRAYHRYLCYKAMGDLDSARQSLEEVIHQWSADSDVIAFVRKRRDVAKSILDNIEWQVKSE